MASWLNHGYGGIHGSSHRSDGSVSNRAIHGLLAQRVTNQTGQWYDRYGGRPADHDRQFSLAIMVTFISFVDVMTVFLGGGVVVMLGYFGVGSLVRLRVVQETCWCSGL